MTAESTDPLKEARTRLMSLASNAPAANVIRTNKVRFEQLIAADNKVYYVVNAVGALAIAACGGGEKAAQRIADLKHEPNYMDEELAFAHILGIDAKDMLVIEQLSKLVMPVLAVRQALGGEAAVVL